MTRDDARAGAKSHFIGATLLKAPIRWNPHWLLCTEKNPRNCCLKKWQFLGRFICPPFPISPLPGFVPYFEEELMNLIWTDGACHPNPGFGGWGYLIHGANGRVSEGSGGEANTTNNRMEMTGIFEALQCLPADASATVYSDSQYCVNGLTVWAKGWAKRNWMTKDGAPMPNRDLWLQLEAQKTRLNAQFRWVKGHAGNAGNERADVLAEIGRQAAMESIKG